MIDLEKPVILLDLSSYVFYRYYAIQRWMIISKREELSKEEIYEKFDKMFEDQLKKMVKKYATVWSNVLVARDCPRERIWRMEFYPEYKGQRDDRPSSFDPEIFSHTYSELLPKLITKYKFSVYECDQAEADDIIAVFHKKIRRDSSDCIIYIMSQDSDFLQLQDNRTNVRNFADKLISETIKPEILNVYLRWKIIRGDVSDNIPAIDKKVGDVTALKLALDKDLLETKLNGNPVVREQYMLNDLLISFQNIPPEIVKEIEAKLI
jgi:5'-3' exonuclease